MIHTLLLLACQQPLDTAGGVFTTSATDSATVIDSGTLAEPLTDCEQPLQSSGEVVGAIDCTDGVCEVPEGPFFMGDSNPSLPDQCPERSVHLSAFAIDRLEVSIGEFDECIDAGACSERTEICEDVVPEQDHEQLPATCVSWESAQGFCEWRGGRLPTEAEWEKAARGEEGARFAWGPTPPSCLLANFRYVTNYCQGGLVEVGGYASSTAVGSVVDDTQSAYGLLDTVGNAWEWTADWYDYTTYKDAPDTDPPGPELCSVSPVAPRGECSHKVIRGGAYNTVEGTVRGSTRSLMIPTWSDRNLGFRCAYDR